MFIERPYPKYSTYEGLDKTPSVLSHEYPKPTFQYQENYYPENKLLKEFFSSGEEIRKFGAASFCGFLEDTIEVEHCLVIPSIASLRRLPYDLPSKALQNLYELITDEGHHADQALRFLAELRGHFDLGSIEEFRTPLFLRRLEHQRLLEPNPRHQDLITVMNGIVTETRISVELSKFANDAFLAEPVRNICRTHAEDEAIHSSQFRALGRWLWSEFDEVTRELASRFIVASTIARSLPDTERIAYFMHQATNRSLVECKKIVYTIYDESVQIEEMLFAARPTISYFRRLGVENYVSFETALEEEKMRLKSERSKRLEAINE